MKSNDYESLDYVISFLLGINILLNTLFNLQYSLGWEATEKLLN
jgi:hypothetical protein